MPHPRNTPRNTPRTTSRSATARSATARSATALEAEARAAEARLRIERANLHRAALATYRAAERSRLTADWKAPRGSADLALIPDLPTIQARARQLVRDDAYAASLVRAFERNVVGRGLAPIPQVRNADGSLDVEWNALASAHWSRWSSNPRAVDRQRRRTWSAALRWAIADLVTVGEALFILSIDDPPKPRMGARRSEGARVPLILQCVEGEQLGTDWTDALVAREVTPAGGDIRGGVEVDEYGAAVAYWIRPRMFNDLPGGNAKETTPVRVPADRVLHLMEPRRARQTRGEARLASVLVRLRDLAEYDRAQLVAARAEACMGLVVTTQTPDLPFQPEPPAPAPVGGAPGAGVGLSSSGSSTHDTLETAPFMVARLAPGELVTPFVPARPGSHYAEFVRAQLRAVAAGSGIGYEQLARDFTDGTYSSQRQAMLEDRREYRDLQEQVIALVCAPVWREWVDAAIMAGLLPVPAGDPLTRYDATWTGDGYEWIDPAKEAQATALALEGGLDTKERILRERGLDWRQVAEQRAAEIEYETELAADLPAPADRGAAGADEEPPDGGPPPENGDETEEPEDRAFRAAASSSATANGSHSGGGGRRRLLPGSRVRLARGDDEEFDE